MTSSFTYTKVGSFGKIPLKRFLKKYKIHLLIWPGFIFIEIIAAGLASEEFGEPINYITYYGLNIGLFYFSALFLLPVALSNQRQASWRLPILIFVLICGYVIAAYVLKYLLLFDDVIRGTVTVPFDIKFISGTLWRSSIYIGLSFAFYYLNVFIKSQLENSELERNVLISELRERQIAVELSKAKNASLQAQLNPHFLNSALNFLHSHTRKSSPAVAELIVLLSKITRFAGKAEQSSTFVTLNEELKQVSSLIELWRIIKDHKIYIEFDCNEDVNEVRTIPFILLTLTENVFKHGDIYNPKLPAKISVKKYNNALLIITENAIQQNSQATGLNSGLLNIEYRLNYIYGDEAMINYGAVSSDKYVVSVLIHLNAIREQT